jgi:hypothetical protein
VEYVLLWLEVSLNAVPCFLVVAVRSIWNSGSHCLYILNKTFTFEYICVACRI